MTVVTSVKSVIFNAFHTSYNKIFMLCFLFNQVKVIPVISHDFLIKIFLQLYNSNILEDIYRIISSEDKQV